MICPKCKKKIDKIYYNRKVNGYYDLNEKEFIDESTQEDSEVFYCPECNEDITEQVLEKVF